MRRSTFGVMMLALGIVLGRSIDLLPPLPSASAQDTGTEDNPTRQTGTVAEGQPRYLEAIRGELEAMRIGGFACQAQDAQRAVCELTQRGSSSQREFSIDISYSDRNDVVYMYVEGYLTARRDAPGVDALMRRLMELNWQMLLGKFEWDAEEGEVRLSTVLNTDSNFDRRAFRSSLRGLLQLADRYHAELARLAPQQQP